CLAVVDKAGATLMVGFNRRFDPHFAAVRKAIDDGAIGDVEMVTITSRDPGAPPLDYIARSGGIFRDMTIHDFDMARFLLGEEPVAVSAHASVLVDKKIGEAGDFDSVSVILETASGKQAVISNSRRATYGYDQRIEAHGSKGMVAAENQRPVSIELANDKGYTRPPL
ncbi:MAG: inositol 2-dehydrogenase, partial [Mesorhizobium sp.]